MKKTKVLQCYEKRKKNERKKKKREKRKKKEVKKGRNKKEHILTVFQRISCSYFASPDFYS